MIANKEVEGMQKEAVVVHVTLLTTGCFINTNGGAEYVTGIGQDIIQC
jgi:hypothetical protein